MLLMGVLKLLTQQIVQEQLAEAGQTGNQIKAATGLSLPTIQLIKKAFGLVKSRTAA